MAKYSREERREHFVNYAVTKADMSVDLANEHYDAILQLFDEQRMETEEAEAGMIDKTVEQVHREANLKFQYMLEDWFGEDAWDDREEMFIS